MWWQRRSLTLKTSRMLRDVNRGRMTRPKQSVPFYFQAKTIGKRLFSRIVVPFRSGCFPLELEPPALFGYTMSMKVSKSLDEEAIHMAIPPDHSTTPESNDNTCVRPQKRRTWLPILGGVLCGMIALCLLGRNEPPVFYHVTAWAINETPPVKMIEPRSVHFTLFMLTLAAIGGSIGVLCSQWRKRTAFLFLLAILAIIAGFAALGSYLESSVWH